MAITTYRERAVAGWANTTPIYQLEGAFAQLGWHAGSVSGIVTGIWIFWTNSSRYIKHYIL